MSQAPDRRELFALLGALVNEAISAKQLDRLEQLLAGDPEARQHYFDYVDVHLGLHQWQMRRQERHPLEELQGQLTLVAEGSRQRRARWWRSLGAYAAVALVASLTALLVSHQLATGKTRPPAPAQAVTTEYLATLVRISDCVWSPGQGARFAGMRLSAGELRLASGLIEVDFDSGPELILEGPARLRIESRTTALLTQGKAVLKSDETAETFSLRTPWSTLRDLGTEYAVAVESLGEELHVFEGQVRRQARDTAPGAVPQEQLPAGSARRYLGLAGGQSIPLDQGRFVRAILDPSPTPPGAPSDLLFYEGFDYPGTSAVAAEPGYDGRPWYGPWRQATAATMTLSATGLHRAREKHPSPGGCLSFRGVASVNRKLPTPIALDHDGVWYFSFLFQRTQQDAPTPNDLLVLLTNPLAPEPGTRLGVGIGGRNHVVYVRFGSVTRVPLPIDCGETYLLVGKIVGAAKQPDQVFLRVYAPDEPVDRSEPQVWSLVSQPVASDLVVDGVNLHVNSRAVQQLDELRFGTSWESVTAVWAE